jgi:hypothetical protein
LRILPNRNRIEAVIHAAERRRVLVLAVEHASVAAAVLLAGLILLLLFGAQILTWYWLALVAAIAFIAPVLGMRKHHSIERYRLAQMLDRRLGLSDALSTAWFLLNESHRDDAFARFQVAHAEAIAGSVRPARAFPFSRRRTWGVSAALAAVACGLFTARYLETSSLSMEQALVPIPFAPMLGAVEETTPSAKSKAAAALSPGDRGELARTAESQQQEDNTRASLPEQAKPGNPAGAAAGAARAQNGSLRPDTIEAGEGKAANGQPSTGEAEQQNSADAAQQQSADAKQQGEPDPQRSSGVLDKMKDALSSLMAKMRASASAQQRSRQGDRSEANQRAGDQTALGQEQQGNQSNASTKQASEQQSTQGQAQGQTTEQSASGQGRNADGGDRKNAGSQSGAGHQDGEKAIKEAEQQQAMGKLAEIIGKRSASLTGDMTVETRGGKQQLKTEYSQRMGRHSDLGGEINRDEIPLDYQQYVRDYMEAVRKQPPQ